MSPTGEERKSRWESWLKQAETQRPDGFKIWGFLHWDDCATAFDEVPDLTDIICGACRHYVNDPDRECDPLYAPVET